MNTWQSLQRVKAIPNIVWTIQHFCVAKLPLVKESPVSETYDTKKTQVKMTKKPHKSTDHEIHWQVQFDFHELIVQQVQSKNFKQEPFDWIIATV